MKRILAAAVLAVFACAVCMYGRSITAARTAEIVDAVVQIDGHLSQGENDTALALSRRLQADWEEMHGQLCLFLQHEHL
ncbi:MAG: hypothetical protein ACI4GO_07180, partial [Hominenteromicrobium sp.]